MYSKSNAVQGFAEAKQCNSEQSRGNVMYSITRHCRAMALHGKPEQWQRVPVHSSGRAKQNRAKA